MDSLTACGLTADELADFRRMAGFMIPADATYDVPGADDPRIFADVTSSLGVDREDIRAALSSLRRFAGGPLAGMDDGRAEHVTFEFLAQPGRPIQTLGRLVLSAYYRDDRVMRSIGREPRAPFPKGHTVPDGDWSLLDAVKARAPIWRDDRKA